MEHSGLKTTSNTQDVKNLINILYSVKSDLKKIRTSINKRIKKVDHVSN